MRNSSKTVRRILAALICTLVPVTAFAQDVYGMNSTMKNTGVSGIWILANISFAGMRAQGSSSLGWRIIAFLFGLPGTLLTFLVVPEGGGRAYGIELPSADSEDDNDKSA